MKNSKKRIAILHPSASKTGGAIQLMLQMSDILNNNSSSGVDFFVFDKNKKNCFEDLQDKINVIDLSDFHLSDSSFEESSGFLWFYKKIINLLNKINKYINISFLLKILYIIRLIKILKGYDIVIAGNSPMNFVDGFSKILYKNNKTFWFLHNIPLYYQDINKGFFTSIKKYLEKKLIIKNIDKIFVPGNFIKKIVKKTYGRKAYIIPPMISKDFILNNPYYKKNNIKSDINNKASILKTKTNINTKKIKLFSYGRLTKQKNFNIIIDSFKKLVSIYPNAELKIAGDGELFSELKDQAKGFNVNFMGNMSHVDIIDTLKETDCFLLSTMTEAFGLSIPEVSSYKIPIATIKSDSLDLNFNTRGLYVSDNIDTFFDNIILCLQDENFSSYKADLCNMDMSIYYDSELMTKKILKYIKK